MCTHASQVLETNVFQNLLHPHHQFLADIKSTLKSQSSPKTYNLDQTSHPRDIELENFHLFT